jgi:hypothetical protein
MAFGLAVYNNAQETLYTREPINMFYSLNIINPAVGSFSFTLPDPGTSGEILYVLAPARVPFDLVKNMNGASATGGFQNSWAIGSFSIVGRTVTLGVKAEGGGLSSLAVTFFTREL